jgi:hypothetical protein
MLYTGDQLDMIPTVSYAAGIPTCLLATYLVESRGLKTGLRIGSYLTGKHTPQLNQKCGSGSGGSRTGIFAHQIRIGIFL